MCVNTVNWINLLAFIISTYMHCVKKPRVLTESQAPGSIVYHTTYMACFGAVFIKSFDKDFSYVREGLEELDCLHATLSMS